MVKYSPIINGFEKLSVSAVKQISGRAGRYGLLEGRDPGGTCTTLHAPDLTYLRQCLATPFEPLELTRIGPTSTSVMTAVTVLPPKASLSTVINAHSCIGRIPTFMRYSIRKDTEIFDYIDRYWTDMSVADRLMLVFAPIPWRDNQSTAIIIRFLNMHSSSMTVDFMEAIKKTGFLKTMLAVENDMNDKQPHSDVDTLMRLESFHKVIVFYIWMSFRSPVVYSQFSMVSDVKHRLEKVLNWSLEALSKSRVPRGVVHRPMASTKYMSKADARSEKAKSRQRPTMAFNPTVTETQKVASVAAHSG